MKINSLDILKNLDEDALIKSGLSIDDLVTIRQSVRNSGENVAKIAQYKKDNRLCNLEIMTFSEHAKLHKTTGRNIATLKCPNCGIVNL